jgi:phosphatidylglycerophosphate synthase
MSGRLVMPRSIRDYWLMTAASRDRLGLRSLVLSDRLSRMAASALLPLVPARLTPNGVSLIRFGLSLGAAACLAAARSTRWWLLAAAIGIFAAWVLDSLDGDLARQRAQTSDRGYYLDRITDTVAKIAIYLGIATSGYAHFEIIIFAPIVETLNDVVTLHRTNLTRRELGAPLAVAHVFLMLLLPALLTLLWPAAALAAGPLTLHWFDIAFVIGMAVSATEMALSAVRLYFELSPPEQAQ